MKTELSDNKEVRFFVLPLLAYSWRILILLEFDKMEEDYQPPVFLS